MEVVKTPNPKNNTKSTAKQKLNERFPNQGTVEKTESQETLQAPGQKEPILNQHLAAAINLHIELEAGFKLYSYRILEPEVYARKVEEVVDEYLKNRNFKQ